MWCTIDRGFVEGKFILLKVIWGILLFQLEVMFADWEKNAAIWLTVSYIEVKKTVNW